MLRAGLLQAIHDASLRLYTRSNLLRPEARREVELSNIQEGRTVTRWEFMDADISQVLPDVSDKSESIAEFLLTEEGLALPMPRICAVLASAVRWSISARRSWSASLSSISTCALTGWTPGRPAASTGGCCSSIPAGE
jgi:hypothetical protein